MSTKRFHWLSTPGLFLILLLVVVPTMASSNMDVAAPGLPREGSGKEPVFLHLKAGTFDPLKTALSLPSRLSYTSGDAQAVDTVIVQFSGPVKSEWKEAVVSTGGRLGGYLPDYAFLVHLDAQAREDVRALPFVRWVGPYQPGYKLAPDVDYGDVRSYRIILASWAEQTAAQKALDALEIGAQRADRGFVAVLRGDQLDQVARLADVIWIEPLYLQRAFNDVGGGTIMGGTTAWSSGYTGDSVTVAIADTGLDTGVAGTIHQDFSGRVLDIHISSWPVLDADWGGGCIPTNSGADDGAADRDSGHGTHVAGSVAGNGARSSGQIKGLGFDATVTFQAVEQFTAWPSACAEGDGYYLSGIPYDVRDLLNEAYGWGARIHNDSWGGGEYGVYDIQAADFDDFIHQHPDMTVVVAAGNAGTDGDSDGYVDEDSLSSPGTAKNVITVGASDNERDTGGYNPLGPCWTWGNCWSSYYPTNPTKDDRISDSREELAAFSSRGPMADGRIKPDVVAPGTNILSTRSSLATSDGWGPYNQYYMYMGGTSMASPLTAGAAAVVREYYMEGEAHANPSAALIKATLINSAVDISGYGNSSEEAGQPIPNNHEGWGRVNVAAATTPGSRWFVDNTTGVGTGATQAYEFFVGTGQAFKTSLVWSDTPGPGAGGKALVNDLDLRVTAPDGTTQYWGNYFSGGWSQTGGSADRYNNVENVYIASPSSGTWTVEVIGQNVPQGPQPFALVVNGNLSQEQLAVTGIAPTRARNNANLTGAVISGSGFESGAQAHLIRGGAVITGTNLVTDPDVDTITADFDLNGATPGLWDVRVTNPSTLSDTLENGFLVIDSALPDLTVSNSATESSVEAGNLLTYTISIVNTGYVTATGVVFTDSLPGSAAFWNLSPACVGGTVSLLGGFACQISGGSLGAGEGIVYTLVVSVSNTAKGTLVNQVVAGSTEQDAFLDDNTDEASVAVSSGTTLIYLPVVTRGWPPIPATPVLRAISNPGGDGDYAVSWNSADKAETYTLQEDDNASFSSPTNRYAGSGTSWSAVGKTVATYYYRVKANNSFGSSAWSNTESVIVRPPLPSKLYPTKDATVLQAAPSQNFGSTYDMWTGYDHCDGTKISRSLVQFDVSAIPPGTAISGARLHLYLMGSCDSSNRTHTITVYRTKSSWSSSTVTWKNKPDYGAAYGSAAVKSRTWGWYSFDVSDLVRGWVDRDFSNYGMTLRGPEGSGSGSAVLKFFTLNRSGTSYDPYLSFTYTGMAASDAGAPEAEGPVVPTECGPSVKDALGAVPSVSGGSPSGFAEMTACRSDQ